LLFAAYCRLHIACCLLYFPRCLMHVLCCIFPNSCCMPPIACCTSASGLLHACASSAVYCPLLHGAYRTSPVACCPSQGPLSHCSLLLPVPSCRSFVARCTVTRSAVAHAAHPCARTATRRVTPSRLLPTRTHALAHSRTHMSVCSNSRRPLKRSIASAAAGIRALGQSNKSQDCSRMFSIIRNGDTFHGISVAGRGVFSNDKRGHTYAGQRRDGHACGLGVVTWSDGSKLYAEHGPDGQYDGRCLGRYANGATGYILFERGKRKDYARVRANGRCEYNGEACAPDDPRVLALIAQVAPVEVRPAAPAPHPPATCPPTRPQAIVRWIGRLVLPPQALAAAVATEVHPHAARRRWWLWYTAAALQSKTTLRRVHATDLP
jgi:hypothetical protein